MRTHLGLGFSKQAIALVAFMALTAFSVSALPAQTAPAVDFNRDIKPILEQKCLRCHGSETTEGDIDLSNKDGIAALVTAGKSGESKMFQILVDTEGSIMPPEDDGGPLNAAEIGVIRWWIDSGANIPDGVALVDATSTANIPPIPEPVQPKEPPRTYSTPEKLWRYHGVYHPAIVHFPVALITIAAFFIVLHWLFRSNFDNVAFYCLLVGAVSSIAACTMGWAFADHKGTFGSAWAFDKPISVHRWVGILTAVLACGTACLAIRTRGSKNQLPWQIMTFVCALLVGYVGHEGGELVYKNLYDGAWEKYFSSPDAPQSNTKDDATPTPPASGNDKSEQVSAGSAGTETSADKSSEKSPDAGNTEVGKAEVQADVKTETKPEESGDSKKEDSTSSATPNTETEKKTETPAETSPTETSPTESSK